MSPEIWNNNYPEGTRVTVTRDDGSTFKTATKSLAWPLGDGTPVVMLQGISGGYLLNRVQPGQDSE